MSNAYSFNVKDLARLLDECTAYKDEPVEFTRNRYDRYAKNFNDALQFLTDLKLIRHKNGSLVTAKRIRKIEYPTTLEQIVKDALLKSNKFIDAHKLILKFEPVSNQFEYSPTRSERFIESNVRNLLISLDIIRYDRNREIYMVEPNDYEEAFKSSLSGHRKLSLKALKAIQDRKELIGAKAEVIALEYEKVRLAKSPELVSKILHIAEIDVAAGYDIDSFEGADNIKRLIEVKAVSPFDFGFEWSANEARVAEMLKDRYFLYLLPVVNGLPNIADAIFIQNPAHRIMNGKDWIVETAGYSIKLSSTKNTLDLT